MSRQFKYKTTRAHISLAFVCRAMPMAFAERRIPINVPIVDKTNISPTKGQPITLAECFKAKSPTKTTVLETRAVENKIAFTNPMRQKDTSDGNRFTGFIFISSLQNTASFIASSAICAAFSSASFLVRPSPRPRTSSIRITCDVKTFPPLLFVAV